MSVLPHTNLRVHRHCISLKFLQNNLLSPGICHIQEIYVYQSDSASITTLPEKFLYDTTSSKFECWLHLDSLSCPTFFAKNGVQEHSPRWSSNTVLQMFDVSSLSISISEETLCFCKYKHNLSESLFFPSSLIKVSLTSRMLWKHLL